MAFTPRGKFLAPLVRRRGSFNDGPLSCANNLPIKCSNISRRISGQTRFRHIEICRIPAATKAGRGRSGDTRSATQAKQRYPPFGTSTPCGFACYDNLDGCNGSCKKGVLT